MVAAGMLPPETRATAIPQPSAAAAQPDARSAQRSTVSVRIVPRVTPNCSWTCARRTTSRAAS